MAAKREGGIEEPEGGPYSDGYQDKKAYEDVKVRLVEGIDVADLFDGKGVTFSVRDEDVDIEPLKEMKWHSNELNSIGIQDKAHEGGPFKGIEHEYTEKVTEDGEIIKKIVKPGSGPIVPKGAWVRVHYSLYVEGNDEPMDSTRIKDRPYDFVLTEGAVIPAISFAIETMKKNEVSQFLASYHYCYGEMGVPPRIPKKARVLIELEVVRFIDENEVVEYDDMAPEDRRDLPTSAILKLVSILREKGNEEFKKNKVIPAYNSFLKGIKIIEGYSTKDQVDENQLNLEKIKLLLNLGQCRLETNHTHDARKFIGEAIELMNKVPDPLHAKIGKGHFLLHKSYIKEKKLDEAKRCLEQAVRHLPENETIREAFTKLDNAKKKEADLEKKSMQLMGKGMGWTAE